MASTRKYLAVVIGALFVLGFSLPAGFASAEWRASTREKIVLSTYPQVSDPDPQILALMDQVESAVLAGYVGDLSGENEVIIDGDATTLLTRYSGEPGMFDASRYLRQYYESLGLPVDMQQFRTDDWINVVATQPGNIHPDQIYIICAHYDSRSETPFTYAPGADDNASGSAAVMAVAGILTQYSFDHTIRYINFSGEEQGMYGSTAYARQAAKLNEEILGVVNLDMIAWDGEEGPDFDLHAGQLASPSNQLAEVFRDVVEVYDLDLDIEIRLGPLATDRSDHAPFWDEGYAAFLAIEDWDDFTPWYHTTSDRLQTLDLGYFTDAAKAAVGTLAILAGPLEDPAPTPVPTSTATPWPTPNCPDHLENGDLEAGISDPVWRNSSAGGYSLISQDNPRQGLWSVWFNQVNGADDSLCQTVTLPANVSDAALEFWWQMQTDEIIYGYDWLEARIQPEGVVNPMVLTRVDSGDLQHLWVPMRFSLQDYAGVTLDLCFVSHSDYWGATHFFVDDVYLAYCSDATPTPTPTATAPPSRAWLPLLRK